MNKRLLDSGIGAPWKVLKANMGDAVWPTKPARIYLATMLWINVVLLEQHEDQLRSGLPWMEVNMYPFHIYKWEGPKCICRIVDLWSLGSAI